MLGNLTLKLYYDESREPALKISTQSVFVTRALMVNSTICLGWLKQTKAAAAEFESQEKS